MKIGDTIVKRYIILKLLRQGESGAVFVCMDEKTGRMVALKQLVAGKATSAQLLWLKQEAQALQGLSHPNLPRMLEHIESPAANCLVLEYRDGSTLEQIVKAEGPRSEVYTLDVARILVKILSYLHSQKPPIVCRDLQPANIMRRKDGTLGLIDFDLSKVFDSSKGPGAQASGYSPPEQNGGPTDTVSDLYSLGATMYFLLTGVVPPPSGDLVKGRTTLVPLRQACLWLSDNVTSAIEKMMAVSRAERPKSVDEVITMLGFEVKPAPPPAPEPAAPAAEETPEPPASEAEPAPEAVEEPAPVAEAPAPEPEPAPEAPPLPAPVAAPPPPPVAPPPLAPVELPPLAPAAAPPAPAPVAAPVQPPVAPPAPVPLAAPAAVSKLEESAAAPVMKPFIPGGRRPVQLPPAAPLAPSPTPAAAAPVEAAPAAPKPFTPGRPKTAEAEPKPAMPTPEPLSPPQVDWSTQKPFSFGPKPGNDTASASRAVATPPAPELKPWPAAGQSAPVMKQAGSRSRQAASATGRQPTAGATEGRLAGHRDAAPPPPLEPPAWLPPVEVPWTAPQDPDTARRDPDPNEPDTLRPSEHEATTVQAATSASVTVGGPLPVGDRATGEVLNNRYRIERVLGQGGMGAVYLASHLELDEPVAIKEMRPPNFDETTRQDCIRQFRIEARILNRLHHPNLPRVYDFFETDDRHYLVMDFIRGVTLDQYPAPNEATVLRWAAELCDVLGYLHSQDPPVIFRDLKPANIMLAEDGSVRLIDFGIAKVFEPDKGATTKTIIQGAVSHGYAAPEQYGGGTDERLDIYGLGAVLYFLLARKDPPSSMDLIAGVADLIPLKETRPDISDTLLLAIEWMMQLARDMRPRTMEECREALGLGDAETPKEASTPVQMRRLLREEFQYFFPAQWVERGTLLNDVYAHVMALHKPPLVLMSGPAGVGKSRMLDELSLRAQAAIRVLPRIRGNRMARQQPFGAMMTAMQTLLNEEGDRLLAALMTRLDETGLHEMSQLFPQLRSLEASATITPLAPLERNRVLLESFRTVLEEVARSCPRLMLCFDDVQWIDSATLRLIDTILATEGELPIVIVLAIETGSPNDAFADALPRWKRRIEVAEIEVQPFNLDELAQYMRGALPPMGDLERHLEPLLSMTRGNPLLLEETLRWMVLRRMIEVKNGMLYIRELKAEVLPATVLDAVRRRLELLPLDAQELLAIASVIGQIFSVPILQRLAGERIQGVEESLARAREAVFIRSLEGDLWEFISEGTREAFYARLAAPQRRQLHMTLGRLEEDSERGPGGATSFHFEQAGDVEKSLEHLSNLTKELKNTGTVEIVVRDGANASKSWADVAELTEDQFDKLKQAMAFVARSLKSMSSYGAHSPVVKTSVEMAATVLSGLQSEVGTCLAKCSEGFYSLNNRELDARNAPPEVVAACKRHHISGFELRPGLDASELTRFLDILANSHDIVLREENWAAVLASRQITTIQVIDTVLVEVSERDLFDPARLRQSQVVVKTESEAFGFDKVRPEAPPPPMPLDPLDAPAVSAKDVGAQLASIQGLLEQVKATSSVRGAAVAEAAGGAGTQTSDPELDESWDWLSKQAQREEILRLATLARRVDKPLMSYLEERPDIMLQEIEAPDRERRTLAAMGILNLGSRARQVLLNYIATSDSAQGRAVAIFLLGQVVDDVSTVLITRLVESSEEMEVVRLLTVMQENKLPWEGALELLLPSSSTAVRKATSRVVLDAPLAVAAKVEILRNALRSENPLVVVDMLQAVTELGRTELVSEVAKLLDRGWGKSSPDTVRAQVQACYTLGHIGAPETVLTTLKGVATKGKLTSTFLGGRESEVRAAAAWAIGRLQCQEGREFLSTLLKDNDYAVRGAARIALETPGVQDTYGKEREFMDEVP